LSYFWNELAAAKTRSLPAADREAYVAAYSRPGRMPQAGRYFVAWPQTAKDFRAARSDEATNPVLSDWRREIVGRRARPQAKLVATERDRIVLKDTGHWIMEERPEETMDALMNFCGKRDPWKKRG